MVDGTMFLAAVLSGSFTNGQISREAWWLPLKGSPTVRKLPPGLGARLTTGFRFPDLEADAVWLPHAESERGKAVTGFLGFLITDEGVADVQGVRGSKRSALSGEQPASATTSCCGIIQGEIPVWEVSVLWKLESGNWTEGCGAWTQERTALCWYGYYVGKTANGPRLAILKPRPRESRPPVSPRLEGVRCPNATVVRAAAKKKRFVLDGRGKRFRDDDRGDETDR
ncbi:hypothetical protein CSOJ01_01487 [Colletotrichum sojae]|uniref:Uncharacterized protein n=1 Tax=Colletotrichum sojae TaxID=2175907 RepID=A0A8H6JTH6_9PEZI|nr:hypothetical protein CSOJ01_01487 [Colletotrichum sojae]